MVTEQQFNYALSKYIESFGEQSLKNFFERAIFGWEELCRKGTIAEKKVKKIIKAYKKAQKDYKCLYMILTNLEKSIQVSNFMNDTYNYLIDATERRIDNMIIK